MKVLIIGLGSIALKHKNALKRLKPEAEVFALRSGRGNVVEDVININEWKDIPSDLDFVMVCNPTSEHLVTIENLVDLKVPLFIEKPPFMELNGIESVMDKIRLNEIRTYTAFNFRFHPVVRWLKDNLKGKRIIEVQAYCGSYLPNWRPGQDYRKVYSAKADLGGGAHLDLIHELDYLIWIFGQPVSVGSEKGKVSDLEIDSTDFARYWLSYKNMNVSVLLNYYRRDPKRQLELVMEDESWIANLLTGHIIDSNGKIIFEDKCPVSETYSSQMKYFLENLDSTDDFMNNLSESVSTLKYALS